jgi:hypothetical protein
MPALGNDGRKRQKRAGTVACPYEWLLEQRKACAPSERHNLFDFPVRADTAVRTYAEDLPTMPIQRLSDGNSNIENTSVGAGFHACPW